MLVVGLILGCYGPEQNSPVRPWSTATLSDVFFSQPEISITDKNECLQEIDNDCEPNKADCLNTDGSFSCVCKTEFVDRGSEGRKGFEGRKCGKLSYGEFLKRSLARPLRFLVISEGIIILIVWKNHNKNNRVGGATDVKIFKRKRIWQRRCQFDKQRRHYYFRGENQRRQYLNYLIKLSKRLERE